MATQSTFKTRDMLLMALFSPCLLVFGTVGMWLMFAVWAVFGTWVLTVVWRFFDIPL